MHLIHNKKMSTLYGKEYSAGTEVHFSLSLSPLPPRSREGMGMRAQWDG